MELKEVVTSAELILSRLHQYNSNVDAMSLADFGYNHNSDRQGHDEVRRLNTQALDLLIEAHYVQRSPDGHSYSISPLGREVVSSANPALFFSGPRIQEWAEKEELLEALAGIRKTSETVVSRLFIEKWRQFSNVDIVFHPRLTILTGANGAGKTTLLNILGPHFNWSAQLLTHYSEKNLVENSFSEVGKIVYSNGQRSSLVQHTASGVQDTPISIPNMTQVPGIFINSHRSVSTYHPLASIPPRFSEWETLRNQFTSEIQARYSGGHSQYSPLYRMKEALVAAAMYAYGNVAVRPNSSAQELWEGYQEVLRRFLPESLEFDRLLVENSEIIIVTRNAEFPLEAVSGGISAMLELSWQIYLRQKDQEAFTVCIDEPENHLHPELQRSVIPSLIAAFPNATFIIATHSPLVVTSTQDAFVYALGSDENGKTYSRRVENINVSATPDETLMSVLGLDTTLPLWAETRLNQLLRELPISPSIDELRGLRDQLVELGLDNQFPAAIRSLGKNK